MVNVPADAVPPPIAPGAAKVAPLKDEAFKLATFVVDVTTRGAVPIAIVEINCVPVMVPAPVMFWLPIARADVCGPSPTMLA